MCNFLWCFEFKQTFIRDFSLLRTKATFRFLIENRWDDVFPPIKQILKSFSKPKNSVSFHQRLRPESILFGVWAFFPVLLGTYYLIWRAKRFQLLINAIILKKNDAPLFGNYRKPDVNEIKRSFPIFCFDFRAPPGAYFWSGENAHQHPKSSYLIFF